MFTLLFLVGYVYIWLNPIIIDKSEIDIYPSFNTVGFYNSIDTVDFSEGDNRVVVYTHPEGVPFLPSEVKKWTLLETTDNQIIEQVKSNFYFEGDSSNHVGTTCLGNTIYFIKNNKLIFKANIIMEDTYVSLYFRGAGWTFANDNISRELIQTFSEFDRVYLPVVLLR